MEMLKHFDLMYFLINGFKIILGLKYTPLKVHVKEYV